MARMSPGLPEGLWRDQFLEIVIEALTGALTPTAEKVLRFYARHTRPADWSERGEGPVCFVAQKSAAERMGMDRKSVYNAERALERLGLIRKDALENGHRRSPAGRGRPSASALHPPSIAIRNSRKLHARPQGCVTGWMRNVVLPAASGFGCGASFGMSRAPKAISSERNLRHFPVRSCG